MTDQSPHVTSYDDVLRHVQQALIAVGEVERAIGDLGDEAVLGRTRGDLQSAVRSLQAVRQSLAQSL